jgi:hypothetical protein
MRRGLMDSTGYVVGGFLAAMVVLNLLLVFLDLAVQLVEHGIDRRIEIGT